MRLDLYLVENAYVKSRQKAKSLIEEGNVKVNGMPVLKPSYEIKDECEIEVFESCPYVSRGGLKLEGILKATKTEVLDKVCLDIGASTGGFTHCLLLNGAKKVFAVDSGTNQLDKLLKEDSRVISMEGFNARALALDDIKETVDIVTIDVSFISQNLIMQGICNVLKENGVFLSLIKPQFEVGRSLVGKGGIVREKKSRLIAVNSVINCAKEHGLVCVAFLKSPIRGGDGNTEYLASFSRFGKEISEEYIKKIVFE